MAEWSDWAYAESDPSDELAQLHLFAMKKCQAGLTIDFVITVREFVDRNKMSMRFFAQADKQINQKTAPFTPFGWGDTLLEALRECVSSVHRFPYEGE